MSDSFMIADDSQQARYQVAALDYGEQLSLRDAHGGELAAVVHGLRMRGVQVRINGREAAMVRARGPFGARYQAEMPGGRLRALDGVYRGGYYLSPDSDHGKAVASVSRVLNRSGTRTFLRLVIADSEKMTLITAIVLAVEHFVCERGFYRLTSREITGPATGWRQGARARG